MYIAATLMSRLTAATAAVRRDRSGRIAATSTAAMITSAAIPTADDRWSASARLLIWGNEVHHRGGGWTEAATALSPKAVPPVWPEPPIALSAEMVASAIGAGAMLCGTPDEVCEQLRHYERTGVDPPVFGLPDHLSGEEAREGIELFGKEVIPQYDKDPVHRTTRFRQSVPQR